MLFGDSLLHCLGSSASVRCDAAIKQRIDQIVIYDVISSVTSGEITMVPPTEPV